VKGDIDRAVITTVEWFRRHEFNVPAVPFTFFLLSTQHT